MVVGMDRRLAAAVAGQRLVGATGYHLIGVHVGLRARARLPDDERELAVEVATRDLSGRLLDGLGDVGLEQSVARVHPGCSLLYIAQCMHDFRRHLFALAEGEILDRSFGLRPPVAVRRDFDRPEAAGFGRVVLAMFAPVSSSRA